MDNERIAAIRARWEAVQHPVVQGLKMPPMAAMEAFSDNADDDIAYLLTELDKAAKVIEAATRMRTAVDDELIASLVRRNAYATHTTGYLIHQNTVEALQRIRAALAAMDSEGGE